MQSRRTIAAAAILTLAIPLTAGTVEQGSGQAPVDATVDFGDPVALTGAANQVLVPDDVTIRKGGSITFIVNGAGHGIAIYPVSKDTTREDITSQLCAHDAVTQACTDATFANGDHTILDGKNKIVIVTGTNPPYPRVDDPTDRLLATSTQIGLIPGVFLTGTTATTPGTQMQVQFVQNGRYLVVCMNRGHMLNSWMFGFVDVVG